MRSKCGQASVSGVHVDILWHLRLSHDGTGTAASVPAGGGRWEATVTIKRSNFHKINVNNEIGKPNNYSIIRIDSNEPKLAYNTLLSGSSKTSFPGPSLNQLDGTEFSQKITLNMNIFIKLFNET